MSALLGRGRVPGNREVSRPVMRAKRAVPEEGVHGGTWFPHGSEAEPSDAEEHAGQLEESVEVAKLP